MKLEARHVRHEDLPRLAIMNRDAYPDLVADGVVYDETQLRCQLATFPAGQRVVEVDGVVRGAISTLIVDERRALAPHTWVDMTGCGTFSTHTTDGTALYLADIYVDPVAQGMGVGVVLYDALKDICRERGLRRIVAGGRLWSYHEVATRMTPEAYVAAVMRGERKDRVLGSQLRAGFTVRGIMREYLHDWKSASFATLLDWPNAAFSAANAVRSFTDAPSLRD